VQLALGAVHVGWDILTGTITPAKEKEKKICFYYLKSRRNRKQWVELMGFDWANRFVVGPSTRVCGERFIINRFIFKI
jgi:hypothetical protein